MREARPQGLPEEELERARLQARTSLVFGQESSSSRMFTLAHQAISLGKVQTLDEQMAEIQAVTVEQVQALAQQLLDPDNLGLVALGTRKGADIRKKGPGGVSPGGRHPWIARARGFGPSFGLVPAAGGSGGPGLPGQCAVSLRHAESLLEVAGGWSIAWGQDPSVAGGQVRPGPARVVERHSSRDGTTKLALELVDGRRIETVHMPREVNHPRVTLCLSSQVGCALGCAFCATGAMGILRNLSAGEIVGQALVALAELGPANPSTVTLVFMGMGEPLHNLDAVHQAIRSFTHLAGLGIPTRRITVSTSGLVPASIACPGWSPAPGWP